MKQIISIILILSLLLLFPLNIFAETGANVTEETAAINAEEKVYCDATLEDNFEEGNLLVSLTSEATEINRVYTAAELTEKFGVSITAVSDLTRLENEAALRRIDKDTYCQILSLEIPQKGKQAVLNACAIIEQHKDVKSASPNYIITEESIDEMEETIGMDKIDIAAGFVEGEEDEVEISSFDGIIPNDRYSFHQYAVPQIDMPHAWRMTTGSMQVLVGVLDTGIDSSHSELSANLKLSLGKNFTDDGTDAWEDYSGHGTHAAGIIGAKGNNSRGVTGVCWHVKMVSLKISRRIVNADGTVVFERSLDDVTEAITYAEENDISILNYSGGGHKKPYPPIS